MSLLNFVWDMDQESKLLEHETKITELTEQVLTLKEWVDYLNKELRELKNV